VRVHFWVPMSNNVKLLYGIREDGYFIFTFIYLLPFARKSIIFRLWLPDSTYVHEG
jgi:hypothetical protein